MNKKPVYKTWLRTNKVITLLLISIILIITAMCPLNLYLRILVAALSLPFLYTSLILVYTYCQFSAFGGNIQSKIHELIVEKLEWDGKGKLLDIGAGSASLIIKAAKAFPGAVFTGIDYWGDNWEYSKKLCEENAQIEGVSERITFVKGSASNLPFSDNEFDALISCLTFHEVKDEVDKSKVLKEAFRVLKKDGKFLFLDLFLDKSFFGEYSDFENFIKGLGLTKIEAVKLDKMIRLPWLLMHKKVLGYGVVIMGIK